MRRAVALLALIAAALAPAASAHHSAQAAYDVDKSISVTGVLTKVDWINPHILIQLAAKDAKGKPQLWVFESNPPAWWRQAGIGKKDWEVRMGQSMTIIGNPARKATGAGYFREAKFQDGTSIRFAKTADGPE